MASFKSDAQGFLVGELIENNRDLVQGQQQSIGIWRAIRADVKSIARGMNQAATRSSRAPYSSQAAVVVPAGRSSTGAARAGSALAATSRVGSRSGSTVVATPTRASNGRFVAGQKNGDGPALQSSSPGAQSVGMGRLSDSIGRLSASLSGADNVDPTINAMKEVSDVVKPMGRGLFSLFGRSAERKKERWYQRFLKALTAKKDDAAPGGGGGSDSSGEGMTAGLVSSLTKFVAPVLLAIGGAIMTGLGLLGAASLGVFVGTKIYEWLDKSGILTKIFDTFDSVKDWFKGKTEKISSDYQKGKEQALQTGPQAPKVGADGRNANDPRRVDQQPVEAPKSIAQAAGRIVGSFQRGQEYMAGPKGMVGRAAARWNAGAGDELTRAAVAAGTDPSTMARIASFESGFNPNAAPIQNGKRLSSAHGYGQFLDGTWTEMLNKHGSKYGVANAGKLTKADAGAMRGDTKLQAAMLAEFTKENMVKGRALGGSDDSANAYAFHNLGEGDASKLLKTMTQAPNAAVSSVLSAKVIENNKSLYGDGSISVSDAYKRMGKKMSEGDAFAADAVNRAGLMGNGTPYRSATVAMPNIPAAPSASVPASVPVNIPPAPDIKPPATPLNSGAGAGRGSINVTMPEKTGQNIGDRGLAHIVTGGMGGA